MKRLSLPHRLSVPHRLFLPHRLSLPYRFCAVLAVLGLVLTACGSSADETIETGSAGGTDSTETGDSTETSDSTDSPAPTPVPTDVPVDTAPAGDVATTLWSVSALDSVADLDPSARNAQFSAAPEMNLDLDTGYVATMVTEVGEMQFELYDNAAPVTVNSFVNLANAGFYDGLTFHRVIEGFMAQGGDPTGLGSGGPGYQFANEYTPGIEFDQRGQLAMANAGLNTNGSQFFITFNGQNGLPANQYTIFGQLIAGDEALAAIQMRDPGSAAEPGTIIESIRIGTNDELTGPAIPEWNSGAGLVEPAQRDAFYAAAPPLTIDPSKTYTAVMETEVGTMRFELFADRAPVTVNSIVNLANDGFYDGLTFHRVIDGFMAQGGDPTGFGSGGPGYQFVNEYTPGTEFDKRGQLAMANAGLNTNGSQFFITFNGENGLPANQYTIFGQLIDGDGALDAIQMRDPGSATEPGTVITSVTIEER